MKKILVALLAALMLFACVACKQPQEETPPPIIDAPEGITIVPDDLSGSFSDLYGGNEKEKEISASDIRLTGENILYDFEEEASVFYKVTYRQIMSVHLNTDAAFVKTGSGSLYVDMFARLNYGRTDVPRIRFDKQISMPKKILIDVYVVDGPDTFALDVNADFSKGPSTAYYDYPLFSKNLTTQYKLSEVQNKWITLELDLTKEIWVCTTAGIEPYKATVDQTASVRSFYLTTLPPVAGDKPLIFYVDNVRIEK